MSERGGGALKRLALGLVLASGLGCHGDAPLPSTADPVPASAAAETASVQARAALAPTIVSFAVQPGAVAIGGTAIVSWTTQNATAVRLAFPTGESVEQPVNGSLSLSFQRRGILTLTLTAFGGGESVSATATVDVGNAAPNRPPELVLRTTPPASGGGTPVISGVAPLTVSFSLCQSSDPDENAAQPELGDTLNWQFHFGDDGSSPFRPDGRFNPHFERFCRTEHTYTDVGRYTATLSVTDKHVDDQASDVRALARATRQVTVVVSEVVSPNSCQRIFTSFDGIAPFTFGDQIGLSGVSFSADTIVLPSSFSGPFRLMSGNILTPFTSPIDITFAEPHTSYNFSFANNGTPSLSVEGLLNGQTVFTHTWTGTSAPGFPYDEGTASAGGIAFDTLRFSGNYILDNFGASCD